MKDHDHERSKKIYTIVYYQVYSIPYQAGTVWYQVRYHIPVPGQVSYRKHTKQNLNLKNLKQKLKLIKRTLTQSMISSRFIITTAVAVLFAATTTAQQQSCSASCKGTTSDGKPYDLSALAGKDYQTVGSDQNQDIYFLNVCGTSKTQCPDDAGDPPVTQGTAVQTVQSGGCYVIGVSCCYFVVVVVLLPHIKT